MRKTAIPWASDDAREREEERRKIARGHKAWERRMADPVQRAEAIATAAFFDDELRAAGVPVNTPEWAR